MLRQELLDDLHYEYREIDGYGKDFNIIISPREPGKTSMFWLKKAYLPFLKDRKPWIYLVRMNVEITEALIDSICDTILNKFTDDEVEFHYTKSAFKDGIVDVFMTNKDIKEKQLFFRIVSLNIPLRRIKLAVLKNCKGAFEDEFIIDPKTGEKYIPQEYFKIKEAYTTWRRECGGRFKMYFCGNPYSLFNPLFVGLGVDISKLKRDSFYVGEFFVIHWAILKEELRSKLLEMNPFYKFDEDYSNYALDGQAVNDKNIKLGKLPINFYLSFVLKMNGKFIGIFQNNYIDYLEDRYFCKFLDEVSARRTIYCFEFEEMIERTILVSMDERMKLQRFKEAMRKRLVSFEDINVYYYCEEVYKNI